MKDDRRIIEIDGVRYAVDRTFDGSPAIYHRAKMLGMRRDHIAHLPPTANDQLVIMCHVVDEDD